MKIFKYIAFFVACFSLYSIFHILNPVHAEAASLYFSPSSGTYSSGRNFTVNVMTDSADQAMNAAEGVINFPTDKLNVVSISKSGSTFNLWVQEPSFSNSGSTGNVRFEGVVLNPGFTGYGAKILSITFRARNSGTAPVNFASGAVLANDGDGTNILSFLGSASFTITPAAADVPEVVSSTLPPRPVLKHYVKNESKEWIFKQSSDSPEAFWVNSADNRLVWLIPSGVTGVSTIFDKNPASTPPPSSQGLFDNRVLESLPEGIHYFHIRFINSRGVGPTLHYKLMVDLTPPKPFKLSFPDDNITPNPRPRVAFSTTDALSGLDYYSMKIGDGDFFRPEPTTDGAYRVHKQSIGTRQILVRAYDKAGNFSEAQDRLVIEPIAPPVITYYPQHLTSPGQNLVIGGTASPNATVEINMIRDGKTLVFFTTKADFNGKWEGNYRDIIPSGQYEVWAKQILENGSESLQSNSVFIRVNSLFFRLWQWLINIGGFILLLLIFLLLLAIIIYYFWHKFQMFKLRLRKEAAEAEQALKYGMTRIREEVARHESSEQITKDIDATVQQVEKEMKDIDELGK